jgi:hypothetical protein
MLSAQTLIAEVTSVHIISKRFFIIFTVLVNGLWGKDTKIIDAKQTFIK